MVVRDVYRCDSEIKIDRSNLQ